MPPRPLSTLTPTQLTDWLQAAQTLAAQGQVNQRIPLLAKADPQGFALHIEGPGTPPIQLGDGDRRFSLMSVVKPFVLLYLLEQFGMETVFQWVGMAPSEAPFNSRDQLVADGGFPRNPMINSGAIVLAGQLPGADGAERCARLCRWLNQQAGCHLRLDEALLESVWQAGREPNLALVAQLMQAGRLAQPNLALETYERVCCLAGTVADLAQLGRLLAVEQPGIANRHRRAVNALMLTCGLYEASPTYALRVGLPMKSSISGALLAVVPGWGAIASYSPALDPTGNPIAGLALVEALADALQLSLFS